MARLARVAKFENQNEVLRNTKNDTSTSMEQAAIAR